MTRLSKRQRAKKLLARALPHRRWAMVSVPAIALTAFAPAPATPDLAETDPAEMVSFVAIPPEAPVDFAELAKPEVPEVVREQLGDTKASYYGKRFAGRPTANGETFDPQQMTAAHKTLPFGTMVEVTNRANGKTVVVRINDRGPFHGNRGIDLSRAAADTIGLTARGVGMVGLAVLN